MNKPQAQKELSDLKAKQAEQDKHIARLEKLLSEPEGVWRPVKDAEYWLVNSFGEAAEETYDGVMDESGFSIGNCFPTKEAAELHVKKLKVIQKLRELAGWFRPDWANTISRKWFIAYNHEKKYWQTDSNYWIQGNHVYFETDALAQAAITTLGDELNCLLEGA